MKEQAEKLISIERKLSGEYGAFELFALFLREDAPDKWDLIISSDWARSSRKEAINKVLSEVKGVFSKEEQLMLSRIIVLDKNHGALKTLQGATHIEHGLSEVRDSNFFGLAIKHAFLITSQRQA